MSVDHEYHILVLFDMDGTLVNVSPWHWKVFVHTMTSVYGLDPTSYYESGAHAGDTHANLIRSVCQKAGLDQTLIESRLPDALASQGATAISLLPSDLRAYVLPGVVPLLQALQDGGQALGLVTGALSPTAQAILDRSGLLPYFPVRACGDEGGERRQLVRLALERARATYGLVAHGKSVVILGDAPLDIRAARDVNARAIAVATGSHTEADLATYHPDAVLPSLQDWRAALKVILDS